MPHLFRSILELPSQWRRDPCKSRSINELHVRNSLAVWSESDTISCSATVPDMHYVAILHDVLLAFQPQLAFGASIGL